MDALEEWRLTISGTYICTRNGTNQVLDIARPDDGLRPKLSSQFCHFRKYVTVVWSYGLSSSIRNDFDLLPNTASQLDACFTQILLWWTHLSQTCMPRLDRYPHPAHSYFSFSSYLSQQILYRFFPGDLKVLLLSSQRQSSFGEGVNPEHSWDVQLISWHEMLSSTPVLWPGRWNDNY